MPLLPMVGAVHTLVPPGRASTHLSRPAKIRLILYFFFSRILCTGSLKATFIPSGWLTGWKPLVWCSLWYWGATRAFPLPYSLSSSSLLCSSICLISWCMFSRGFIVKESFSSDSWGSRSLKVLAAISRYLLQSSYTTPSISLCRIEESPHSPYS